MSILRRLIVGYILLMFVALVTAAALARTIQTTQWLQGAWKMDAQQFTAILDIQTGAVHLDLGEDEARAELEDALQRAEVIAARALTGHDERVEEFEDFRTITRLTHAFVQAHDSADPTDDQQALDELVRHVAEFLRDEMQDAHDHSEALRVNGLSALAFAIASVVCTALVALLTIPVFRRRVRSIKLVAQRISDGDLAARVVVEGTGDVADLARVFNDMAEGLKTAQQDELRLSRTAGMAEMAAGILHNVGNVLNSVGISAETLRAHLQSSRMTGLHQVVDLLNGQDDLAVFFATSPQAPQVVRYLTALSEHLTQEHVLLTAESARISDQAAHATRVVQMQQAYARTTGMVERVDPELLINEALRIVQGDLEQHSIQVDRSPHTHQPAWADRHRGLVILVNLLRNAAQSIERAGNNNGKISVSVEAAEQHVRIHIQDNGVGIANETTDRIFAHGFTTRKDGNGFGLHSSINAAHEMGAQLTFESQGVGNGATFSLSLPRKRPTAPHRPSAEPALSPTAGIVVEETD
jgi:signal transduction histidine kinase